MTAELHTPSVPRLDPEALRWRLLRSCLRLGARFSDGLALGFQSGFDSGPMLDYVYRNRAQGVTPLGRLADRVYLNQIGWRAIRARRELLERTLRELIRERSSRGQSTHLVDIASGPGRYLLELVADLGEADVSVLCRDLDPDGLSRGQCLAQQLGLRETRFEVADATSPSDLAGIRPTPDIVVASGIYEILTEDDAILRSMRGVRDVLASDGSFVFTTQIAHPQLDLIANTLTNRDGEPWVMPTRPVAVVEAWARAAGFASVVTQTERHGLFAVSVARGRAR